MSVEIGRFAEPGMGSVNTYWITSEAGTIVIDGQRELSRAQKARAAIDELGVPIVAVFLTHPHPDHFGGLDVFAPRGSGIPIYGSKETRESIAQDRFGLVKASHEVVKDDFPDEVSLPTRTISDGEEFTIASVRIVCYEWGAGEAECSTVLHLPELGALFCGDIVQEAMTAYLLEGRSDAWLAQLERIEERFADVTMLYPGHGHPGEPRTLIRRQRHYIRAFREAVDGERKGDNVSEEAVARISARMIALFGSDVPVAAIPDLLAKDAVALAKESASN